MPIPEELESPLYNLICVALEETPAPPVGRRFLRFDDSPIDLTGAANEISGGGTLSKLGAVELVAVWDTVREHRSHSTPESVRVIIQELASVAKRRWDVFGPDLAKEAARRIKTYAFDEFLSVWPDLVNHSMLLSELIAELTKRDGISSQPLCNACLVPGSRDALRQVLNACLAGNAVQQGEEGIIKLLRHWGEGGSWTVLQYLLWRTSVKSALGTRYDEARAESTSENGAILSAHTSLTKTLSLFTELPLRLRGFQRTISLDLLSPESRSAWRRMLLDAVGNDTDLRATVLEAALWYADEPADDHVQLLGLDLCSGSDGLQLLEQIADHPSNLVRIRARALLSALRGGFDSQTGPPRGRVPLAQSLTALGVSILSMAPQPPSTWLDDPLLEKTIESTIATVERSFAAEYPNHSDLDEERLETRLFTQLEAAVGSLNGRLSAIARTGAVDEQVSISLSYRPVAKSEEGQPGLHGAKAFATDICFLFKASENGRVFAERATLLQGKRLHMKPPGKRTWANTYTVDRRQISELAQQTQSSFVAFYGPGEGLNGVPIIPAQLLIDLMEQQRLLTRIYRTSVKPAAMSLSRWLTYHVIGMWTGDPLEALVEKARGGGRASMWSMVEITLDRSASRSRDRER